MDKGSNQGEDSRKRGKIGGKRAGALLLALIFIVGAAVGGTLAYQKAHKEVLNKFTPAQVKCAVTEEFADNVKSNVNVTVDEDAKVMAFVRVKLLTYRVNDAGDPIGGAAEIPGFMPGTDWVSYSSPSTDDIFYYYTKPVAPGESPESSLIGAEGITLQDYKDADGGRQVIAVMAEAIQADPPAAAGEAWGVMIEENSVTPYSPSPSP